METRVFFSSEELTGRLYSEDAAITHVFCVTPKLGGHPRLVWGESPSWWRSQTAGCLLVQLDEKPAIPWLAQAVMLQGEPMIRYIPLEPLESMDGSSVSRLATVPMDRVAAAQARAEATRIRQRRGL